MTPVVGRVEVPMMTVKDGSCEPLIDGTIIEEFERRCRDQVERIMCEGVPGLAESQHSSCTHNAKLTALATNSGNNKASLAEK
jgi:hypothetical protein